MKTKEKTLRVEETKVVVPSQIGIGDTEIGKLATGLGRGVTRPNRPHKVVFQKRSYLVGDGVQLYTTPLQRMDFLRLGSSPEAQALTYTAIGLALGPGSHPPARIVVGFPVEVLKDPSKAEEVTKMLKGWMVGKHEFTIDGDEYCIELLKPRVIAQPVGAYWFWSATNTGEFKVTPDEADAHILIVDIGFNTLDLYALQQGQLDPRYTGGDTAGVRRAAEMLMDHITREYEIRISRMEANDLLLSSKPIIESAGRSIDLTTFIDQALDAAATQISDFCETKVGNGNQFARILFTGGGSELLRKRMLKRYPSALVLPDAVSANSVGFAYAGRMMWPESPVVIGLDPGFGGFKVTVIRTVQDDED